MVREYCPPTLFLTLSCAEYNSLEIATYLRKVNDVSDSYPIGKLCTEDLISVSRIFSQKYHDFFRTVILNGKALGSVAHYFCKTEYQARGAPHYHILLWIDGAPVAGKDDDDVVLQWIQERITCPGGLFSLLHLQQTVILLYPQFAFPGGWSLRGQ